MKSKNKLMIGSAVVLLTAAIAVTVGCAPQPVVQTPEGPAEETDSSFTFTWKTTSDCSMCHDAETHSTTDASLQASVHAQAGATCVSCHNNETVLAASHIGATPASKMPATLSAAAKVSPESCTSNSCHEFSEDVTADVTDLTDLNGTMVNPHTVMGLTDGHKDIVCGDCHQQHTPSLSASQTCVACHHAGVYECNTCH